MATQQIGPIVIGCLTAGSVATLALVVGPVAGAQEHVIPVRFSSRLRRVGRCSQRYRRSGQSSPSDGRPSPQDGVAVARDLHILLDRGRVTGPFVLVCHSSGAQYVRIFAGRYREQVAGMVLLDGQPADAFERLPTYPAFYDGFRRVSALLPSLARLGVGRLVFPANVGSLPANARSLCDELAELPRSLAQARSFQNLGDRPLVVVTAATDAQAGWLPLQDEMATLSTNSSHRVVPYTHDAIITDQTAAQTSSQAIRDVLHAVRFATSLKES